VDKPFHTVRDFGWARITHPYHPLRGQRFKILKIKRSPPEDDILMLEADNQSWRFIPREWTDKASNVTSVIFRFLMLLEIVEEIKRNKQLYAP